MSDSLQPHGLYSPQNSPGQNTGVGSHSLLQGIFPAQGSNPGLSHCRWILYQLSHQGNPRILEWVASPSPGDLPNPGVEPGSPALQGDSLPTGYPGSHGRRYYTIYWILHEAVSMLSCFSHVPLVVTPWTVAPQPSSVLGILQVRILEWLAMPSSRGSSRPTDQTDLGLLCLLPWRVLHH